MGKNNSSKDLVSVLQKLEEVRELEQTKLLKIEDLTYPAFRTRSNINEGALIDLTANIKSVGLLTPILVLEKGKKYEVLSGVKRVRACQNLGYTHIICLVMTGISDKQALLVSISDNLNRDDLNAFDSVFSLLHLISVTLNKTPDEIKSILNKIDNFEKGKTTNYTLEDQEAEDAIRQILAKFGRIKLPTFILRMKVLEIHDILVDAIRNKGLNYTLALVIDRIKDEQKMKKLLAEVLDKNIPLKELRTRVQEILGEPVQQNPFQSINKKVKLFQKLPKEKQLLIHQKLQEIELILAG